MSNDTLLDRYKKTNALYEVLSCAMASIHLYRNGEIKPEGIIQLFEDNLNNIKEILSERSTK